MTPMRLLDLFSGIGGFSLGLERSGAFRTVAFCEIEPFPRKVLAKHWPKVPCYDDVRTLTADRLAADGIAVDAVCGGFPCQDISTAGKGAGLAGERSGLWSEYARIVGELRPRYVIVENVAALLGRGLGDVLGDLAALGYDAEWQCIPASAVGAPHRRDRVWIIAHTIGERVRSRGRSEIAGAAGGHQGEAQEWERVRLDVGATCEGAHVADAARERRGKTGQHCERSAQRVAGGSALLADAYRSNVQGQLAQSDDTIIRREQIKRQARLCSRAGAYHDWSIEPDVGRVAHGVPNRVGQLRGYGNAVVPQIPELIGRAILVSEMAA